MWKIALAAALVLSPPVDGPVERPFQPPAAPWGPGHRGVDYRAAPGTPVRVAADGVVAYAGGVAGGLLVTVDHAGDLRSTYAYLSRVDVEPHQPLGAGDVVGLSGGTGPGHGPGVVHFGVRRGGRYVDPTATLGRPWRVRLAPLDGRLSPPTCPGPHR